MLGGPTGRELEEQHGLIRFWSLLRPISMTISLAEEEPSGISSTILEVQQTGGGGLAF